MSSHPFGFPYPPYPSQLELCKKIFEIYRYGDLKNVSSGSSDSDGEAGAPIALGLLESPTGTGKSMAIVCALTAFLEENRRFKAPKSAAAGPSVPFGQRGPVVVLVANTHPGPAVAAASAAFAPAAFAASTAAAASVGQCSASARNYSARVRSDP